jgi:hydroxyacylglutathione hydrolase
MRLVADDVYLLRGFPPNAINVYLAGDVLIDAATVFAKRRILRQLEGRKLGAHAVTHAHPDHFGASHAVCAALGIPLWCGAQDAGDVEAGHVTHASRFGGAFPTPPGHPVARRLEEGDDVAGFTVLNTFGHSPGHISFWREADRTLICGDVSFHLRKLAPPPDSLTVDPERNRESMQRLAALEPQLVLFGHGPPLRGGLTMPR